MKPHITLVNPPYPVGAHQHPPFIPLGLGYIAAVLEKNGFTVDVIDCQALKLTQEDFKTEIQKRQPTIVGVTSTTLTYKSALQVLSTAKEVHPNCITAIGGPHVTFWDENALKECPALDVVVRKEGENTMLELAQRVEAGKPFYDLLGTTTRNGDKIIKNDEEALKKFYENYKDDIFIGFNCRSYDQFILKGLLLGMDAGYINNKLILENKKGYEVVKDAYKIPFNNFDIMPNPPIGLKTLEAFMGSKIKETSTPFDIDRELTELEEKELLEYCITDVRETIKIFKAKREEFDSQLQLIEAFDLDMIQFNKTKAQLSAHILGAKKQPNRGDEFDFIYPDTLRLDKYKHIKDWYDNPKNRRYADEKGKKKQLEVEIAGVQHILGYGGIHGSRDNYVGEGIILCCDISSMYPSLIIEYGFMSRNVDDIDKYRQIRDERLRLKAEKNPK
jgi:methylmalonyl-CoA mutase cobalamin-binding subunit